MYHHFMAAKSASSRRFDIALSFPGEHRDYVEDVAGHLVPLFNKDRILYDKYYEAEFARPDLDVYLPGLYRTQSELIVLFLCPEYAAKCWCRLEWRHIGHQDVGAGAAESFRGIVRRVVLSQPEQSMSC